MGTDVSVGVGRSINRLTELPGRGQRGIDQVAVVVRGHRTAADLRLPEEHPRNLRQDRAPIAHRHSAPLGVKRLDRHPQLQRHAAPLALNGSTDRIAGVHPVDVVAGAAAGTLGFTVTLVGRRVTVGQMAWIITSPTHSTAPLDGLWLVVNVTVTKPVQSPTGMFQTPSSVHGRSLGPGELSPGGCPWFTVWLPSDSAGIDGVNGLRTPVRAREIVDRIVVVRARILPVRVDRHRHLAVTLAQPIEALQIVERPRAAVAGLQRLVVARIGRAAGVDAPVETRTVAVVLDLDVGQVALVTGLDEVVPAAAVQDVVDAVAVDEIRAEPP